MMPRVAFISILLASLVIAGCAFGRKQATPPLQVVPTVDLTRYVGTWYEIARFPHRFQEGCVGSRATYSLLEDGKVGVLNECYKGGFDGPLSSAKGKAWVVDTETNAKLKVSFFWPFSGDYWIIDLGPGYEYAVVGHPSRDYLWILSRTPKMEDSTYRTILEKLQRQAYDTSRLTQTLQK